MRANLIIAGVTKAGTTSLFSYLRAHRDVAASSVKETCFFLPIRYDDEAMADLGDYERFFEHCETRPWILESTPGYFYDPGPLPRALDAALENLHVIIILREPVERFISFFNYKKHMLAIDRDMSLAQYVETCATYSKRDLRLRKNDDYFGLEGGAYGDYIESWLQTFGDRLKVVFFDELGADPAGLLNDICSWLEIDPNAFENLSFSVENRSTRVRLRPLHQLALAVNSGFEPFLRAHPRLKKFIRSLYQGLNAAPPSTDIDSELRASLTRRYAASNERLRQLLLAANVVDLPKWL